MLTKGRLIETLVNIMQILRKFKTIKGLGTYINTYPVHVPDPVRWSDDLEYFSSKCLIFAVPCPIMEHNPYEITAKQVGPALNVNWEKFDQLQKIKQLFNSLEDMHKNPQVFYQLLGDINSFAQQFN